MHSGRRYRLWELLRWTRGEIYALLGWALVLTVLYAGLGWQFLAMPWVPVALVGTAAAFIVGFKNNATYSRLWEARQIYGGIVNTSRSWGVQVRDLLVGEDAATETQRLVYRHLAWLTALRYQLREPRPWETVQEPRSVESRQYYEVAEHNTPLPDELARYLSQSEHAYVLGKKNRATHLLSLQSQHLKRLTKAGQLDNFRFLELGQLISSLYDQQGKAERIKNFPYPRHFATINLFFVRLFLFLVPLGMLQEAEKLGHAHVWLTIPFSVLVSWVFATMEKIGSSTENPFEGGANDVPITALSRTIEIDLRELIDETDLPPALQPVNHILM